MIFAQCISVVGPEGFMEIFFKISGNFIEILMVDVPGLKPFKDAILYKVLEGQSFSG